MRIDWDRIGSEYHDVTRIRQLCNQIAAQREAALDLLREIAATHFLALPTRQKVDALLAEVAECPGKT